MTKKLNLREKKTKKKTGNQDRECKISFQKDGKYSVCRYY